MAAEALAVWILMLTAAGLVIALLYILCLTRFFKALRAREPDVWKRIGSPTLANMLFLPFHQFKKYYAFLPVLRDRAMTGDPHAWRALFLLRASLWFSAFIALHVLWLAWLVA